MRVKSLSYRLVMTSAIVAVILLLSAGMLLGYLFQVALERNFDARLQAVLDGLLANVLVTPDGRPTMQSQIADTRFMLPLSGWYWQVNAINGEGELASPSLLEKRLTPNPHALAQRDEQGVASFSFTDAQGQQLRAIERQFRLFGSQREFSFIVAGNFDELKNEINAFRNGLYVVLSLLGAGLLLAIFLQVRVALRPVQNMQKSLSNIRAGKAERLEGQFASELQPVADELNLLIQANAEIIDRARTQVGNLAHALKTPLSVLTNEAFANKGALARQVGEQAQIMQDQINLYLDRARRAAGAQSRSASVLVKPVIDGLSRTIMRIHQQRSIRIDHYVPEDLKFRGEAQDLEEMAGNLLDNAAKWANSRITVVSHGVRSTADKPGAWLEIIVDDDGPGLPEAKRAEAVLRGKRLDETKPGSGLGLSIVTETAAMYGGTLILEDAKLGGLRVILKLPSLP